MKNNNIWSIIHFKELKKYNEFINEIKTNSLYTYYDISKQLINGNTNYKLEFKTNSNTKYVLLFYYKEDIISPFPNKPLFNISFTTLDQFNINDKNEFEKETNKFEVIELMKRLIYIIDDFYKYLKHNTNIHEPIFLLGETDNLIKINLYRNIIKDSLPEYVEIEGKSSFTFGKPAFYYFKK